MSLSNLNKHDPAIMRLMLEGFFESIGRRLSPAGLRIWMLAFADLTVDEARTAIVRFSRESTDFPSPAAVRQHAGLRGLTNGEERSEVAWRIVRTCISRVGAYESVDFDDPAINAAIRSLGGWPELTMTASEALHWRERDFKRAYRSILLSGSGDGAPLHGLLAVDNSKNGHGTTEPRRIVTGLTPTRMNTTEDLGDHGHAVKRLADQLSIGESPAINQEKQQ